MIKPLLWILMLAWIPRGCPAQQLTEISYRTKVSHTCSCNNPIQEKGDVVGILHRVDSNYWYFKALHPTQDRYIMLSRRLYTEYHLMIGDTIVYDLRPDISFRIKQVRINRTTRRFKR